MPQPLNKTFAARNKGRIGLITLPYAGRITSMERVVQFCADDILKIEYNGSVHRPKDDGIGYQVEPTYANITTKTKGDTYLFIKREWPEGTDKAIAQMYSRAMDGHDIDFRDYLPPAHAQSLTAPLQLAAPHQLASIPIGRVEYAIDSGNTVRNPQPPKPLP